MQPHGGNVFATARRLKCDWRDLLDLSASINPLGPSPRARRALCASMDRLVHYPENGSPDLRRAAAQRWGVHPAQILPGNGATELLHFVIRHLVPANTLLVVPTFSEYRRALTGRSVATAALLRQNHYRVDFEGLARQLHQTRADFLILTNPNNPAGVVAPAQELAPWLSDLPISVRVLLDESFVDFTAEPSLAALTARRAGLFVLRSLTKFYALPGLRAGCLVADRAAIARLAAAREPWTVNVLAEQATAAALGDCAYLQRTVRLIARERAWCWKELRSLPSVDPVPSATNFFLVHCTRPVAPLETFLLRHRILIRDCTGLEGISGPAFRFAVRRRPENVRFLARLKEFLC